MDGGHPSDTEDPGSRGASAPLRSRSAPARCRSARRDSPGTFLIHLRDAGEECPRPVRGTPRIAAGPPVTRALATGRTTSAPAAGNPSSGKLRRNRRRSCADEKRSKPKEWGRSEVKRSRAGSPHGEPRTEPPSEAAERDPLARGLRSRGAAFVRAKKTPDAMSSPGFFFVDGAGDGI